MLNRILSCVVAISVAASPAAAGEIFFRYTSGLTDPSVPQIPVEPEEYGVGNDIHAFYVAPVGRDFSKRIPVTTNDVVEWRKDSGTWPAGMSLDAATGLMSGSPLTADKQTLLYHGYDAQGHAIARARLSFTTFMSAGMGSELNLYAHTGQYFYHDIPLPSGLNVYRWEPVDTLPSGISMLGNALQGVAEAAGTYGIAWRGFDFVGREVAYVYGELLVQDGPVIEVVADQTAAKDAGQTFNVLPVVQHRLGPLKFNLVAEGVRPPGLDVDVGSGRITGVYPTFETSASFHYVVTDTADGTQQKSNTFKLSTLPATVSLASMPDLSGTVGDAFFRQIQVQNLQPGAQFILKAGTWPEGIAMDANTGIISGKPTKAGTASGIVISVSGPSMTTTDSRAFDFSVYPESIEAVFTPLSVRVETPFATSGARFSKGDVAPLSFAPAVGATIPSELSLDVSTGILSSNGIHAPGDYSAILSVANGEGQPSKPLVQQINVYNDLSISYSVPAGQRLKPFSALPTLAVDSIVGTAQYSLASGNLPDWLQLDRSSGVLKGTPVKSDSVRTYPPFEIAVSDDSGETKSSGPIAITVEERDELSADIMNTEAERFVQNQRLSFRAVNAYEQPVFKLVQGSLGVDPDSTLAITRDGYLVGSTKDPVGTVYSDLVVRVTDGDDTVGKDIPISLTVVEPASLSPLTGSLDVALTWTRDIPFNDLALPELANGYGVQTYALSSSAPNILLDPLTHAVSGTVPDAGTHEFTYTIDDETERTPASGKITLTILDPMTVTADGSYAASVGEPISIKPSVSDGIAPITYTFTGVLPQGLRFASGAVVGKPLTEGTFGPFTMTTSDRAGTVVSSTFDIVVGPPAPLEISWTSGPFQIGKFGRLAPTVSGALGTLEYRLVDATILPKGISFHGTGHWYSQFAGTPTEAGRYPGITINVTDPGYDVASTDDDRSDSIEVELWVLPDGDIQLPASTMKVRAGTAFTTEALSPANALQPFKYTSVTPSGLPYDLVLNPTTGTLTGKMAEPGLYGDISIALEDDLGRTATTTVSLDVVPALEISAPSALAFRQYAEALSPVVIANPAGTVTYAMSDSSPPLPSGLRLDGSTGVLTGYPDTVGTTTGYVIVATDDADGSTAETDPFSITIAQRLPLDITGPETFALKQYVEASTGVTIQNAVGEVTFSIAPALPQGFTLDEHTGTISGSSDEVMAGISYTITAVDSKGGTDGTDTMSFMLVVDERHELGIDLPESHAFTQYFDDAVAPVAKNVVGSAEWSISPDLPTWATFDSETGRISALSEEAVDPVVYTLTLSDDHDTISKTITLSVADRDPLEITDGEVLVGLYDRDLELPLTAKNALGDLTWSFGGGTLPDGLDFDAPGGSFVGHPNEFGQFPGITIIATDEKGRVAQKTFTIDVQQNGSDLLLAATPSRRVHVSSMVSGELPSTTNAIGKVTYSASGLSGSGLGIDPLTGEIRGTPTTVGTITAEIKATDATKREAFASMIIDILPDLSVTTPTGRIGIVYNRDPADIPRATASNGIADLAWTLKSGTLPKGLSIDPQTGTILGRAKQLGDFGPFTVEVIDGAGGEGGRAVSDPMWLTVEMNDDPIELTVADYTAYAGSMINTSAPAFNNELGTVTFFSPDVAALGLTINPVTGVISGTINELADVIINVSIKDSETLRVTSRPLHLQVFPELRLTYPAVVNATQAVALLQNASVGFNIGTVTYSKGAGEWPDEIVVNPSDGTISSTEVTSEAKTYSGLTVAARVVFNGGQTTMQQSNAFAIKVNPIQAVPLISNIDGNRMVFGTVGDAATPFTPKVVDNVKGKPWNYGGTVYTLNHDLAADTGLTFNAATGTISGTPTKAVIYRDLAITVTSSQGDTATTAPFWFGIAPDGDIVASSGQKDLYKWRKGQPAQTDIPRFDNWIGNPAFKLGLVTSVTFDTNTGIMSTSSLPDVSSMDAPVTLTDEFGREGTFTYRVEVLEPLTINVVSRVSISPGGELTEANAPTASRIYGTATYTATDLPTWASIDPSTDSISAKAPAEDDGKSFVVSVTVTDSHDGHSQTASYRLVVENIAFYRLLVDAWHPHPSFPMCVGLAELRVMSGSTDITSSSVVTVSSEQAPYIGKNLTDGSTAISNTWFSRYDGTDTGPKFVDIKLPAGKNVTSMAMYFRTDGAAACSPRKWRVQTSPDKVNWTTAWSDEFLGVASSYVTQPR